MTTTTKPLPRALLAPIGAALLATCACSSAPPPFTLRIASQDIVPTAVDRVEVELEPQMVGQRFACRPAGVYFGGGATTRVTGVDCAVGTFLITLERGYLDENRGVPDGFAYQWHVDLPLYTEETMGQPMTDVLVDARFYRGSAPEPIADGQRFVSWPLAEGGAPNLLRVQCTHVPVDHGRECSNNDPLPMADGGTASSDGGM